MSSWSTAGGGHTVGSWKTWLEERSKRLADDRIQRENAARIMAIDLGWLAKVSEWVHFGPGGEDLRRATDEQLPAYGRGFWLVMPPDSSSEPDVFAQCGYTPRAGLDDEVWRERPDLRELMVGMVERYNPDRDLVVLVWNLQTGEHVISWIDR